MIGSSDGGPGNEEAPPGLADEMVNALPSSVQYLVWVDSPEGRKAAKTAKAEMGVLGGFFGGGFKVRLGCGILHGVCRGKDKDFEEVKRQKGLVKRFFADV